MLYLVLKLLHIAAVVLFLGNITTGVFWKAHADRTRDPKVILATMEGIIASDRLFTIPGVIAIVLLGVATAMLGHYPMLRTGWIFWSLVLFLLSGVAFGRVGPLQRQMAKVARQGVESGKLDWAAYDKLTKSWNLWGLIALLAPFAILVLMVLKPAVRGL